MTTLGGALRETLARLEASGIASSRAESEILVAHAYQTATGHGLTRAELYLRDHEFLPDTAYHQLGVLVKARQSGRPIQHLTGSAIFLDHEYAVSPAVLIPRPETEVLVRRAQALLGNARHGLEIGLGSGVISIELLARAPSLHMTATELDASAAEVALLNARRILGAAEMHRLEVSLASGHREVLEPFTGVGGTRADFLVANPPYLWGADEAQTEVIRHEPRLALFAPTEDPLYFYRRIAEGAHSVLKAGAWMLLELAHERADQTRSLFTEQGWSTELILDLTGRPRVLEARSEAPWIA